MYCPHCQKIIPDNSENCPYCNSKFSNDFQTQAVVKVNKLSSKTKILIGVLVFVAVLIVALIIFLVYNSVSKNNKQKAIDEANSQLLEVLDTDVDLNIEEEEISENASLSDQASENSFIITLYPNIAPITCENFENLVSDGFYDGLTFHRVVDDFVAQGGDPKGDGTGGSSKTIKGEFSANGVENNLSHKRGVVSMARSQDMNDATSQFFICYTDCDFLDGQYAAFGEVTYGMNVVDSFLNVERSLGYDNAISSPKTPITIDKAVMIESDSDGNPRVRFTMKDF